MNSHIKKVCAALLDAVLPITNVRGPARNFYTYLFLRSWCGPTLICKYHFIWGNKAFKKHLLFFHSAYADDCVDKRGDVKSDADII